MKIRPKTPDEIDAAICGRYWVWLYAERKRRGTEPTDAEKRAHPSSEALRLHREQWLGRAD